MRTTRSVVLSMIAAIGTMVGSGCGGAGSSASSSSVSVPIASFDYSPTSPTVGQIVQFIDTSSGLPARWSWTFGDGGTATSQNPAHTFTASGSYAVTLTVVNAAATTSVSRTLTVSPASDASRTIGLMLNDNRAFDGYLLFAPKQNTMTYLIDNEGRIVNQWTASKYAPGQSVYLLENGHLLRSCMTKGKLSSGGGEGGRVEEYDWDDQLVWELDFSTDTYMQHHDIRMLPNGNLLMLVVEKKTYAEVIAAGFNPSKLQSDVQQKGMLPDAIVEIEPTRPAGGRIVWEWHVWDHLVQDYDASKANYGSPAAHPELIDASGDGKNLPAFWNHMNSIDYHAEYDQIVVSVRGNSEAWIIDHSTTTGEAKGHSGGKRGKGGDLLYRWGNPICYRAGTAGDQRYFQQHDVEWVRPGYPGAGNLTCFNNGLLRGDYSTVDEFVPAVDATGNYAVTAGSAFGPKEFAWTYRGSAANPMYSENISGAHRLPNGNTIICSGTVGLFLEVTTTGEIVWKYVCPVDHTGRLTQGTKPPADPARTNETMNSVFRVYKYAKTYGAFTGRTLTPGDFVERY